MQDGSRKSSDDRSFIGFYTDPKLKKRATRRAQEAGISLSEWMRRQLRRLGQTPEQKSAT